MHWSKAPNMTMAPDLTETRNSFQYLNNVPTHRYSLRELLVPLRTRVPTDQWLRRRLYRNELQHDDCEIHPCVPDSWLKDTYAKM